MSAESKKVGIQILDIHFHVRNTLRPVNQNGNTVCMGSRNHLFRRIDSAQHITYMSETHQLGPFRKEFLIFIQQQFSPVIHGNHFQHDSFTRSL